MKQYEQRETVEDVLVKISCDKCKKEYNTELNYNESAAGHYWQINLFKHIKETGGYASKFGDMEHYEVDFCDTCWFELIGPYIRYV